MMALTGIELLEATDKLDDLLTQRETASGIDLLDLQDEIDAVMQQLGYGVSENKPEETEKAPAVVDKFLAGDFVGETSANFIPILQELDMYLDHFITLQQVIDGAEQWWEETGKNEAQAA